jgi:hypothetical protein
VRTSAIQTSTPFAMVFVNASRNASGDHCVEPMRASAGRRTSRRAPVSMSWNVIDCE